MDLIALQIYLKINLKKYTIAMLLIFQSCKSLENDIEQHIMFRSSPTDYVIAVKQVNDGIESLAKGKSDGDTGMLTDNIVNSPQICSVMLSLLFSSMLIHGYLPDELSKSVIVPIPKNVKESLCASSNYRGIALCSPISKLFEVIVHQNYISYMDTSNLQFAFKAKHSSTICASVLKEVISYYKNRGSDVYCCLVDATAVYCTVEEITPCTSFSYFV